MLHTVDYRQWRSNSGPPTRPHRDAHARPSGPDQGTAATDHNTEPSEEPAT